jgi:hypothetical protein
LLKYNRGEDVRVIIFTGEEFIWLSREKPDKTELLNVCYRYDLEKSFDLDSKIKWLPLIPVSVDVTLKVNGANSANITFLSTRDYLLTRESAGTITLRGRYAGEFRTLDEVEDYKERLAWRKVLNNFPVDSYTLDPDTFDIINESYFNEFYEILKGIYEGFPDTMISTTYSEVAKDKFKKRYRELSWPFIVFQPLCPVWIDVLDETGTWRAIFTGYITEINESYSAASRKQLTISASSFLQLLDSLPSFPNILDNLFWIQAIKDRYEGEKADFLVQYFLKINSKGSELFWPNYWQDKTPLEILQLLFLNANYRLGIISDAELLKVTATETAVYGSIDVKGYKRLFNKYVFHKFSYFGFSDNQGNLEILPWKGYGNERSDNFDHVLIKENKGKNVLESVGRLYIAHEFLDTLQLGEGKGIPLVMFQRIFGYSVSYYHPQRQNLSVVLKKFAEVFKMDIYNTPKGDLVIEFPRINYKPKLVRVSEDPVIRTQIEQQIGKKRYPKNTSKAAFMSPYKDHGENYVIKETDMTNSTFAVSGKIITYYQVKGSTDIANLSEFINTGLLSGFGFADPESILRFGLNEGGTDNIYFALERTMLISGEEGKSIMRFSNELAECFIQLHNARNFNASIGLINRTDLLPGRTILIPHREFLYYITQISHRITPGQTFSTSISASYGHPFDKPLLEVPEILAKYKDIQLSKLNFINKTSTMNEAYVALNDFGIYVINGNNLRETKSGIPQNSSSFIEGAVLGPLQYQNNIPPGVFGQLFSLDQTGASSLVRVLAQGKSGISISNPTEFSKLSTEDPSITRVDPRLVFHLLYWRFLWWVLIQKVTAFGALVAYLVNNESIGIASAVDLAAKLLFFHFDPNANYTNFRDMWKCSIKGDGSSVVKLPLEFKIEGVDLIEFYEKALKTYAKNLYKPVFGVNKPVKIENGHLVVNEQAELEEDYVFESGKTKLPLNSRNIAGFSVAKIGLVSMYDTRGQGRLSKHPLNRAADIGLLYADFTHPSSALAFLIGLDLLMLSNPIYFIKLEKTKEIRGAWTLPPVYGEDDKALSTQQGEVAESFKNNWKAWFFWNISHTTKNAFVDYWNGLENDPVTAESGKPFYESLRKYKEVEQFTRITTPLLGLSFLLRTGISAKSDTGGEHKYKKWLGNEKVMAGGTDPRAPRDNDWALASAWETDGNFLEINGRTKEISKDLGYRGNNDVAKKLFDNSIISDNFSNHLASFGEIYPYGETDPALKRFRIAFDINYTAQDKKLYAFFVFSMLAVLYRWGWIHHILNAFPDRTPIYYPHDDNYKKFDEETASLSSYSHMYQQAPVFLQEVNFRTKNQTETFACPGLDTWFNRLGVKLYNPGPVATTWSSSPAKETAGKKTTYYIRMEETFRMDKSLEPSLRSDDRVLTNREYVVETFAPNTEWRNQQNIGGGKTPAYFWKYFAEPMNHYDHIHTDIGIAAPNQYYYWYCVLKDIAPNFYNEFEKTILEGITEYMLSAIKETEEAKKQHA